MPCTYTDERVERDARAIGIEPTRESLATYLEEKHQDYVAAWEVRTGRPWNEMTREEAYELVKIRPSCARNPGVLSRLLS